MFRATKILVPSACCRLNQLTLYHNAGILSYHGAERELAQTEPTFHLSIGHGGVHALSVSIGVNARGPLHRGEGGESGGGDGFLLDEDLEAFAILSG